MPVAHSLYMGHIRRILVPVDGSPASLAGLSRAALLADDLGASVEVLHVIAPDEFEVGSATPASKPARERAQRDMDRAITAVEGMLGERLRRRTVHGDPMRTILEMAAEEHIDLIVLGTHGRVGRLHALVGSVAVGIVRNASCPVLTVRCP